MAIVTAFTAERSQEIENTTIVDGEVVGDNLILRRRDEVEINAGSVRGPAGTNGTNGTNGGTGPVGPAGPTAMIGLPNNHTNSLAQMAASGDIGITRNNVSVIAGHCYGINVNFTVEWNSVQLNARWDIWCRLNGANFDRFDVIMPGYGGTCFRPVRGQVFWTPSVTRATDDITVYAENVTSGALLTPSGSVTLKRDMWIIDYGVLP